MNSKNFLTVFFKNNLKTHLRIDNAPNEPQPLWQHQVGLRLNENFAGVQGNSSFGVAWLLKKPRSTFGEIKDGPERERNVGFEMQLVPRRVEGVANVAEELNVLVVGDLEEERNF